MKSSIFVLTASAFITSAIFITSTIITSCNTPSQKVEKAIKKVEDANKDLDKANQEYLEDIENYRQETAKKIAANGQSITELKKRIAYAKQDARINYNNQIAELEQKNIDLEKKLADYKGEGKDKWKIFEEEFNHDMDELGKALNDLTVKNVK